jgi:hypothetical protein
MCLDVPVCVFGGGGGHGATCEQQSSMDGGGGGCCVRRWLQQGGPQRCQHTVGHLVSHGHGRRDGGAAKHTSAVTLQWVSPHFAGGCVCQRSSGRSGI